MVLDGVFPFPRSCLPLSPTVSPHLCLRWMVCPPSRGLVSQLVSRLVSQLIPPACAQLVCQPVFLFVSQLVFLLVSLCWMMSAFPRPCLPCPPAGPPSWPPSLSTTLSARLSPSLSPSFLWELLEATFSWNLSCLYNPPRGWLIV